MVNATTCHDFIGQNFQRNSLGLNLVKDRSRVPQPHYAKTDRQRGDLPGELGLHQTVRNSHYGADGGNQSTGGGTTQWEKFKYTLRDFIDPRFQRDPAWIECTHIPQ